MDDEREYFGSVKSTVYPRPASTKTMDKLKVVGLGLDPDNAIRLSAIILNAALAAKERARTSASADSDTKTI